MKILIIEDEARIAKRLMRMLDEYFDGTAIVTICESLARGIGYIEGHEIDLLLLDLNLNGEDGFDVLGAVVARSFHTIIVSANTDRAIEAFSYGVIDFVPKPFDQLRLYQALDRIATAKLQARSQLRFLAVRRAGSIVLIDIAHVHYIKGAGIYSELHLLDGKTELHDKSLDSLQQLLSGTFERIHKSYLVGMTQAEKIEIQPGSRYLLVLQNGERLPIGRSRYAALREKMP